MKTGDTIQLAESVMLTIKEVDDRHRVLTILLYEVGNQISTASDCLWQFVREAHPEADAYEIVIDRALSVLIVGVRKRGESL